MGKVQNRRGPLFLKEIDYSFGTAEMERWMYGAETVEKQNAQ